MDISACNYDILAEVDDGSCEAPETWLVPLNVGSGPAIPWCGELTDAPTGYVEALFSCAETVINNDDFCINNSWDGVCNSAYLACLDPGCLDELACNYNPDSNVDDGSCIIAGAPCEDYNPCTPSSFYSETCECVGYFADTDGDGVCDAQDCAPLNPDQPNALGICLEIPSGCTDEESCNYDPEAIVDDGSCAGVSIWIVPAEVTVGMPALAWCDNADLPDGYMLPEQICAENVILNDEFCTTNYWDNICLNAYLACLGTLGCTEPTACNYDASMVNDDGSCTFPGDACLDAEGCFPEGNLDGNCDCISSAPDTDGDGICDFFEIPGCTDPEAENYNPLATDDDGDCYYPGCKEPAACNFDPVANLDDGSCVFPGMPCDIDPCLADSYWNAQCECVGTFVDEDNDGVCIAEDCDDQDPAVPAEVYCEVVSGCTDSFACNYDPTANMNDGSCVMATDWWVPLPETNGSAIPICSVDESEPPEGYAFGASPCIEWVMEIGLSCELVNWSTSDCAAAYAECMMIVGCMDPEASNYDPEAIEHENDLCIYTGCTDEIALNFDPDANEDDGSCTYDIVGCTSPSAFNYDPSATLDVAL